MTNRSPRAAAAFVVSLSAVPFATAAEPADAVVVTATRTPTRASAVVSDISVITREEIDQAGVSSLAEILQGQPGVEITQNGGLGTTECIPARHQPQPGARARRRAARRLGDHRHDRVPGHHAEPDPAHRDRSRPDEQPLRRRRDRRRDPDLHPRRTGTGAAACLGGLWHVQHPAIHRGDRRRHGRHDVRPQRRISLELAASARSRTRRARSSSRMPTATGTRARPRALRTASPPTTSSAGRSSGPTAAPTSMAFSATSTTTPTRRSRPTASTAGTAFCRTGKACCASAKASTTPKRCPARHRDVFKTVQDQVIWQNDVTTPVGNVLLAAEYLDQKVSGTTASR